MNEGLDWQFNRDMSADYEFETKYGKSIKMEGITQDAIELDEHMKPIFWIWMPMIPEDWLTWFSKRYIKCIKRTPVAYRGEDGFNWYKPQTVIYHPDFEIRQLNPNLLEIKIVESSLWKET